MTLRRCAMSRHAEQAVGRGCARPGAALALAHALALAGLLSACAGASIDHLPSRAQQQAAGNSERAARLLARGDLPAARQAYLAALASAQAVQDPALEAAALLNLTLVHARLGDSAAAHAAVDQILDTPSRFAPAVQARAATRKALLRLDEGAGDDALRWAGRASATCASPCALAATLDTLRGQVAFSQGDSAGAALLAQRAIAAASASAQDAEQAGALRLLARAQMRLGQTGPAAEALAHALAIDLRLGQPDRLALDLVYAAENETLRGNPALAADLHQRALAVFTATGDTRNADVLRQRLVARPVP
jgi:tetratricopeptide (TPR) repeat protein